MNLQELHGAAVAAWCVVLAAEAAVEARVRAPGAHRTASAVHGWIGLVAEAPLIAVTVVTGLVLMVRMWPVSTLVLVKAALGLVAAAASKLRVWLVAPRICVDDDMERIRLARRIALAGTAVPLGAVTGLIGYLYWHGA
ncbi:hypothetical protein GQ57_22615 [Burkholderia sp. MSh2]|uniref:Uncharacterized protein n=1 Tax=Burkholderia paludis TaxID=1506587 RepID=A0A6J5F037_9BURK|nr:MULTISPECIES: hypothetical protein [Burkholderia]KEZ03631.1 hypothetical protein GQ57_22615 [Burkholderia sp. MSh2]KFG97953.1 hypothetical protein GQ56_0106600 [Burkholderia paludis]CAB3770922.1 hypothetical protein LMG30113_06333 [Burkholderia paludis]VWC40200.1 hypothetical protein BPA30113_06854 [Burkholderia paludis]